MEKGWDFSQVGKTGGNYPKNANYQPQLTQGKGADSTLQPHPTIVDQGHYSDSGS